MTIREDQNIEFKQSWSDLNLKSICAFANTDGGRLYVGIDDNGNIVGIQNAKARIEDIPNTIRNKLGILVSLIARNEEGKDYLEIIVPKMEHPVFFDGKIYIRVGSTNQLVDGNNLIEFILRKSTATWDAVVEPNVNIDDLDENSFRMLLDDGIRNKRLTEYDRNLTRRELLEKMSLIKNGKLTRAAILLFHPHPEYFFGGAHIKLGYFNEKNQLRYQDELYGSLLSLAKQAEELLVLKYFYATIEYDGLVRVETLPYPREAVREGILNALMHKNYMSDQPISIRVSPYEMWIYNRSIFPSGWTEETLYLSHESKLLNPNIAVGFFRAGLVERFGSGIQKIISSCIANGNPTPKYSIQPDMVTLKMGSRHENIELALGCKPAKDITTYSGNEKPDHGRVKSGIVDVNPKIVDVNPENVDVNPENVDVKPIDKPGNKRERRSYIINQIRINPEITADMLSTILSISKRTIDRDILWFRENGYISRQGADKNGRWIVLKELEEDE